MKKTETELDVANVEVIAMPLPGAEGLDKPYPVGARIYVTPAKLTDLLRAGRVRVLAKGSVEEEAAKARRVAELRLTALEVELAEKTAKLPDAISRHEEANEALAASDAAMDARPRILLDQRGAENAETALQIRIAQLRDEVSILRAGLERAVAA